MARFADKIKARQMRREGKSVKDIAKTLRISRGTASLWVRDIILSIEQLENLRKKMIEASEKGRLIGAFRQKERRLKLIEKSKIIGLSRFTSLKENEFFTAGLALYWGEGCRKTRRVQFCNSDPKLVNFLINWFVKFFEIDPKRMTCRVGINEIHRSREKEVRSRWSKITKIPLEQFRKTSFKKAKIQKVYENFNEHFGTLSIDILKPGEIYYKIIGLVEGLAEAGCRLGSRGVS